MPAIYPQRLQFTHLHVPLREGFQVIFDPARHGRVVSPEIIFRAVLMPRLPICNRNESQRFNRCNLMRLLPVHAPVFQGNCSVRMLINGSHYPQQIMRTGQPLNGKTEMSATTIRRWSCRNSRRTGCTGPRRKPDRSRPATVSSAGFAAPQLIPSLQAHTAPATHRKSTATPSCRSSSSPASSG